jgi:hypothetical protein
MRLVQQQEALIHLGPPGYIASRAGELKIHRQAQKVRRHVVNLVDDDILLPEAIKDIFIQMGDVGDALIIGKDLEGAQMHSRLDFHDLCASRPKLVGEKHRVFLGKLGVEIIVGDGGCQIVKPVGLGKEVVDGCTSVTHDGMGLEKLLDNGKTFLDNRVGGGRLIVLELESFDDGQQVIHYSIGGKRMGALFSLGAIKDAQPLQSSSSSREGCQVD